MKIAAAKGDIPFANSTVPITGEILENAQERSSEQFLNHFEVDFAWNKRGPGASQLRNGADSCFSNLALRAAKQKRALMFRIGLQGRHDEDEALEISKCENGIDLEMSALVARPRNNVWERHERK